METIEFPVIATKTDTPEDSGFTVNLEHPFDDTSDDEVEALPKSFAITRAIEHIYDEGYTATDFDEGERVSILVIDASGNFVDTRLE